MIKFIAYVVVIASGIHLGMTGARYFKYEVEYKLVYDGVNCYSVKQGWLRQDICYSKEEAIRKRDEYNKRRVEKRIAAQHGWKEVEQ